MPGGNGISAAARRWRDEPIRPPATVASRLDHALKKIAKQGGEAAAYSDCARYPTGTRLDNPDAPVLPRRGRPLICADGQSAQHTGPEMALLLIRPLSGLARASLRTAVLAALGSTTGMVRRIQDHAVTSTP